MQIVRKALPVLVAAALASGNALAQDECVELQGAPPGLYATTDEGRTFLVQDGKVVELGPGDAGFADDSGVTCIKKIPRFLDWPCSTDAARSRKFATYSIDDLPPNNRPREIVRRYFEVPEVIEPVPRWIEGEYHLKLPADQIYQFASEEYWYHPSPERDPLDPKRPRVLQISLYVGINQVVVDNFQMKALMEFYGDEDIPVYFNFNDSNVVPISYFGPNVSLEEVLKANSERGINIAEVPMWELGDYNIRPTIAEMRKYFDIPPLEDIPPAKRQAIEADLEEYGFSKKPIFVSIFGDSGTMVVDQPQRIAVAASMGMTSVPASVTIIQPDVIVQRCGPGTPTGLGEGFSISGETTPPGGAVVPPGSPVAPPPDPPPPPAAPPAAPPAPEPPASGS